MAELGLYTDEYYPVYVWCAPGAKLAEKMIELTDKEIEDLKKVEEKWSAWQDRLSELYNNPSTNRV